MSTVTGRVVADMLRDDETTAVPRTVVVDGEERPAAWFEQLRRVPQGSPAWRDGQREYVHAGLYVLGELPRVYREVQACGLGVVFVDGDGGRWYVAGWADEHAARSHPEYHPLGVWFLLQREQARFDPAPDEAPLEVREA